MKCHICGAEYPEHHGEFCSAAWPPATLYPAIYYFNHAVWCKENGYDHDADIYFQDVWYMLFALAEQGSLL